MTKTFLISAAAGALLLAGSGLASAAPRSFDNASTMDLSRGQMVHTTCAAYQDIGGKVYCFLTQSERTMAMRP